MVNIVVLGWYGTETIGDRAILAGLFRVFGECYDKFEVCIGSLYPFFTERTIYEDETYYKSISENKLQRISVFPCQDIRSLRAHIKTSNFVIIGGGPITDINYLYIIEYGFKYARQKKIKTGVVGCGLGPFNTIEFKNSMHRIISLSDVIILRDEVSMMFLDRPIEHKLIQCSIDPAVFAADFSKKQNLKPLYSGYISFNFRDIEVVNTKTSNSKNTAFFVSLINNELKQTGLDIHLVPMHTFIIGGDDRYYLNKISRIVNNPRVIVHNEPMSLEETMNVYKYSDYCYGMRFHSVLLQTVLNGYNSVLDYTNKKNGKTIGLLQSLGIYEDLVNKGRYLSLSDSEPTLQSPDKDFHIRIHENCVKSFMEIYISAIKQLQL